MLAWDVWPGALALCLCPQSTQKADPPWGWAVQSCGLDLELVLVTQMSWANLRAAFPALSPAQLHRLLTQYQLASAMGPMSAWEPVAQDCPDAFKSGKHCPWAGLRGPVGCAGGREAPERAFPGGACTASGTSTLGRLPPWYPALCTPGDLHSWESRSPRSMAKFQASGASQIRPGPQGA